jgi:hypothetical protein
MGTSARDTAGGMRRGKALRCTGASMTMPHIAESPSIFMPRLRAAHMSRMTSSGSWPSAAAFTPANKIRSGGENMRSLYEGYYLPTAHVKKLPRQTRFFHNRKQIWVDGRLRCSGSGSRGHGRDFMLRALIIVLHAELFLRCRFSNFRPLS